MSRRLARKIDFRVLPVLTLLFILNILDRNNVSNGEYISPILGSRS